MSRSQRRLRALFVYSVAALLLWAALAPRSPELDPRGRLARGASAERSAADRN